MINLNNPKLIPPNCPNPKTSILMFVFKLLVLPEYALIHNVSVWPVQTLCKMTVSRSNRRKKLNKIKRMSHYCKTITYEWTTNGATIIVYSAMFWL